tara:strand:- start:2539 stop:3264 length:726 start_codon:yes stop_codon:yes gene_type:complete
MVKQQKTMCRINTKGLNGINMMQAVIFDMDGTLINSEPMWKEAEKQVFSSVGVEVTKALSSKTASMTTREVTQFWYDLFPWSGKSLEQVESEVVDHVAKLISIKGTPMEGVKDVLDFFHEKKFKIGLSTNAPSRLIPIVLEKLDIAHYFHAISSSEDEINGKPDPAVYLSTAKKLKVEPSKCIAFEDSISGVISAIKANMITIVVPPALEFSDKKYEMSYIKLRRLSEFSDLHLDKIKNTR